MPTEMKSKLAEMAPGSYPPFPHCADFLGLTQDAAESLAEMVGWEHRVVRIDEDDIRVNPADIKTYRVNLELDKGKVTAAREY